MSEYNAKNYTEQGGEVTHIGGTVEIDGTVKYNSDASIEGALLKGWMSEYTPTNDTLKQLRTDFNTLLGLLKEGHVMRRDPFFLRFAAVNDTDEADADRQYNISKISMTTYLQASNTIMVALSDKLENLKDFDAGEAGVHKWIGIGVGDQSSTNIVTDLTFNGEPFTEEDVAEATAMGLSAGYFVLWIPLDLVVSGEFDSFVLDGPRYDPTQIRINVAFTVDNI